MHLHVKAINNTVKFFTFYIITLLYLHAFLLHYLHCTSYKVCWCHVKFIHQSSTQWLRSNFTGLQARGPTLQIFVDVIPNLCRIFAWFGLIPMIHVYHIWKFITWLTIYGGLTKFYKNINESSDSDSGIFPAFDVIRNQCQTTRLRVGTLVITPDINGTLDYVVEIPLPGLLALFREESYRKVSNSQLKKCWLGLWLNIFSLVIM